MVMRDRLGFASLVTHPQPAPVKNLSTEEEVVSGTGVGRAFVISGGTPESVANALPTAAGRLTYWKSGLRSMGWWGSIAFGLALSF
ncbi:hypothetical protein ALQ73_200295 [Pseudomonas savastanoi pv. glycinea]|uniref:Uncharacterized protein n=1 Tax=Pseudomonas savastanoi pv. glycinea TaxID=318 RepID=A0A3M3FTT3_PSESG|nr:hypothetical protein ALQ73_200295 [Pseudomonas savastanoi pv. glycinea]